MEDEVGISRGVLGTAIATTANLHLLLVQSIELVQSEIIAYAEAKPQA